MAKASAIPLCLSLAVLLPVLAILLSSRFTANSTLKLNSSSTREEKAEESIIKMATTTEEKSEIYGVKIHKNPPQSKLDELSITSWPKWTGEPSKFPWTFKEKETMYLFEGKVEVNVDGYEGSFEIGAGDLVVFPKGMKITWHVLESVTKHYHLEEE